MGMAGKYQGTKAGGRTACDLSSPESEHFYVDCHTVRGLLLLLLLRLVLLLLLLLLLPLPVIIGRPEEKEDKSLHEMIMGIEKGEEQEEDEEEEEG